MRHWLWVFITLSTALVPFQTSGFPSTLKNSPWVLKSFRSFRAGNNNVWSLSMQQNATQTQTSEKNNERHLPKLQICFELGDQGQLLCDMFAILIACQLIGLLDVVNDPEFVRNGGWLQPVPAVPSTMGSLIHRVALLSCLWFPLSLLRITGNNDGNGTDRNDGIADNVYSLLLFIVIRLGITAIMNGVPWQEMELLDALRDCYMVALTTSTFRYIYRQYLS